MFARAIGILTSSSDRGHPLARRLLRGGLWILLGRSLGIGVVLAVHMVLARVLSAEEFAAFVLASTIVVCFSMAAMFGLNTLVCRYVAESFGLRDARRAREALRFVMQTGAVTVLGFGACGWLGVRWLGDRVFDLPQLSQSAGLIALWIMLLAVSQMLAEMFRGLHHLPVAAILGGVSGGLAVTTLLFVGIVVASQLTLLDFHGVAVIATASFVFPIAVAAIYLRRCWPREGGDQDRAHHELPQLTSQSVFREAVPIMLVQVFSFGLAQLDIWIVGAYCGDADLAVYAVVRRLSVLVAIPLTQIGLIVASSISELHAQGDRERLERVLRTAATVGVLLTGCIAAVMIALPTVVLDLTFGAQFQRGALALRILCAGQIIYALTGLCGPALMMTGRQRIPLLSLMFSCPLFLLAPLAATNSGIEAVAIVSAAAVTLQNLLQWVAVRVFLGIRTHPYVLSKRLGVRGAAVVDKVRRTPEMSW